MVEVVVDTSLGAVVLGEQGSDPGARECWQLSLSYWGWVG